MNFFGVGCWVSRCKNKNRAALRITAAGFITSLCGFLSPAASSFTRETNSGLVMWLTGKNWRKKGKKKIRDIEDSVKVILKTERKAVLKIAAAGSYDRRTRHETNLRRNETKSSVQKEFMFFSCSPICKIPSTLAYKIRLNMQLEVFPASLVVYHPAFRTKETKAGCMWKSCILQTLLNMEMEKDCLH